MKPAQLLADYPIQYHNAPEFSAELLNVGFSSAGTLACAVPIMERAAGRTAKSGCAAARYAPHSSCRRLPDQAVSCASRVWALCAVHIALASRSPRCFGGRAVRRGLGARLESGGDPTD